MSHIAVMTDIPVITAFIFGAVLILSGNVIVYNSDNYEDTIWRAASVREQNILNL